ncbi:MAG: hypothetical protein AABW64_03555 [Nanoarchaeota archaeon]
MDTRGSLLEVGALILIVLTSIGAYKVISESQHIYVGDTSKKVFYDYKFCPEKIKQISNENTIIFDTLAEARDRFKEAEGCVTSE